MAIRSAFVILQKCRFWLNKFGLCFERSGCSFGSITVANWAIQVIYSIPMGISVLLSALLIVENHFDLTASSVAIIVIVGGGQIHVIYLVMVAKNSSLIKLIGQLQKLVDQRKSFWATDSEYFRPIF